MQLNPDIEPVMNAVQLGFMLLTSKPFFFQFSIHLSMDVWGHSAEKFAKVRVSYCTAREPSHYRRLL